MKRFLPLLPVADTPSAALVWIRKNEMAEKNLYA